MVSLGTRLRVKIRFLLKLPAAPLKRDSKCKEVIPFYCSALANPAAI